MGASSQCISAVQHTVLLHLDPAHGAVSPGLWAFPPGPEIWQWGSSAPLLPNLRTHGCSAKTQCAEPNLSVGGWEGMAPAPWDPIPVHGAGRGWCPATEPDLAHGQPQATHRAVGPTG